AVEPLVAQNVLDELSRHDGRIGEEPLEVRLQLSPRLRADERLDELDVDLLAEARAGDEDERAHALRVGRRVGDGDRAAERVSDEVCVLDPERVEELAERGGEDV